MPKTKLPAVRFTVTIPAVLYAAMEKERWAEKLNRSGFIHQALCERLGLNYGTLKADKVLKIERKFRMRGK